MTNYENVKFYTFICDFPRLDANNRNIVVSFEHPHLTKVSSCRSRSRFRCLPRRPSDDAVGAALVGSLLLHDARTRV